MVASTGNATVVEPLDIRAELEKLDPPSSRDREIFHAAAVERKPQDQVADDFGISQARVSQVVGRVRTWLMTASDDETGDLPPEMAQRLGVRLARMRLEHLLTISMQCFEMSQGKVPMWRNRQTDNGRVQDEIVHTSFGDLRYLTHYRHVTMALAKLDGAIGGQRIGRPERSAAEVRMAQIEMVVAQQRVELELAAENERERLQDMKDEAESTSARIRANLAKVPPSQRGELEAMFQQMEACRAERDTAGQASSGTGEVPTPEELHLEESLYKNFAQLVAAAAASAEASAASENGSIACGTESERKCDSPAAENGEKRAYNSAPQPTDQATVQPASTLTDEQRQRRREFLAGLQRADAA